LEPGNASFHDSLAEALTIKQDWDGAIASKRNVTELAPNLGIRHRELGLYLQNTGRLNEAIAAFRKSTEVEPKVAGHFQVLARGLQGKGDVKNAVLAARRAVELAPTDGTTHYDLGDILIEAGALKEAAAELEKAREDPRLEYSLMRQVEETQRKVKKLIELDQHLSMIVSDPNYRVEPVDLHACARLCYVKQYYKTTLRVYGHPDRITVGSASYPSWHVWLCAPPMVKEGMRPRLRKGRATAPKPSAG
jgi:tetratricopeptide (TPR) repeat protein